MSNQNTYPPAQPPSYPPPQFGGDTGQYAYPQQGQQQQYYNEQPTYYNEQQHNDGEVYQMNNMNNEPKADETYSVAVGVDGAYEDEHSHRYVYLLDYFFIFAFYYDTVVT